MNYELVEMCVVCAWLFSPVALVLFDIVSDAREYQSAKKGRRAE